MPGVLMHTSSRAASRRISRVSARSKKKVDPAVTFPTVADGVKGIAFIEAAVKSSARDGRWVKV